MRTWATTGNTDTVTDVNLTSTSRVDYAVTGGTQQGQWKVVVTPTTYSTTAAGVTTINSGTFVVTSTDSESAGLTYTYKIL